MISNAELVSTPAPAAPERPRAGGTGDGEETKVPEFSEEALALAFSAQQAEGLRHVEAWGTWMIWNGKVWWRDEHNVTLDRSRFLCRKVADRFEHPERYGRNEKPKPGLAAALSSKKMAINVLYLAKADRRQAAVVEQWDADGWLINTPAGGVDLRKDVGLLRPHRPEDYITKITAVAPAGECPLWKTFLARVTGGDVQLQLYLQRVAGYCLTGSTREHAMFFLYGTGANGKSVFIGTLSGILGGYARTAPIETFTESQGERHPTELAGLRGARLVTATETEEGRKWAEAKIKALTGGDRIAARYMRQDFFEYVPAFKLMIAGNHKPHLRTVDEAVRRRFHLVPFAVTIPDGERDEQLADKLRAEWPGILAWAIEGALEWSLMGLRPPEAVRAATDEYLRDQDMVQQFLEEWTERQVNSSEAVAALFDAWRAFAQEAGAPAGNKRWFGRVLEAKGYAKAPRSHGGVRRYAGVVLTAEAVQRLTSWRRQQPAAQSSLPV